MSGHDEIVGVVLGHQAATSQTFAVGLEEGRTLEVDELVAVTTPDPEGDVTTFGIVTEAYAQLEGASLPSDSAAIARGEMPGELVRTAEVLALRVDPRTLDRAAPRPVGAPSTRRRADGGPLRGHDGAPAPDRPRP